MLRVLFVALALSGQTGQPPAEIATKSEAATFRARTNEVQVPVVVRDSKGQTVAGLRAEDFRLFDKGKPQAIVRLTPVDRESNVARTGRETPVENGGAAAPARFTVFLIDDIGSWSRQLRDAAIRYVGAAIRPEDRVAILATSRRYSIDFSADPEKLADTLRQFQIPQFVTSHQHMSLEEISRLLQDIGRQALDGLRDSVRRLS